MGIPSKETGTELQAAEDLVLAVKAAQKMHAATRALRAAQTANRTSLAALRREGEQAAQVSLRPTKPGVEWDAFLWEERPNGKRLDSKRINRDEPLAEPGISGFQLEISDLPAQPGISEEDQPIGVILKSQPVEVDGVRTRWLVSIPNPEDLDCLETVTTVGDTVVLQSLGGHALSGHALAEGRVHPDEVATPSPHTTGFSGS